MRRLLPAVLLCTGLVATPAAAAEAAPGPAAEYAVVRVETVVNAPIDKAWGIAGPFCSIEVWSPEHAPCRLVGDGGVGSTRQLKSGLIELMAAQTRHSYTYVQPDKDLIYHGSMAAEPVDPAHTRLVYTALYNEAPFPTAEARAAERKRRSDRWIFQLGRIKALIESTR